METLKGVLSERRRVNCWWKGSKGSDDAIILVGEMLCKIL